MNTYETIDLNEYVRTGEGGTAITYTHKSRNTLAKLYNPGFEAEELWRIFSPPASSQKSLNAWRKSP